MNGPLALSLRSLALATISFYFFGCPATSPSSNKPETQMAVYVEALRAGQYDKAYQLTSQSFRKRVSQKEFIEFLRENPGEVRQFVQQLTSTRPDIKIEALIDLDEAERIVLVKEGDVWKIASDPINFYSQLTPADALKSFVRALERRRYKLVIQRFVPAKRAETLTPEMLRRYFEGEEREEAQELLKNLKANLNAAIHISGDTASMPYGERHIVRFVREDGVWKIENPN